MFISSNERPFKCTICAKSYKTSSMRAAHMDSHIAGKTFEVTTDTFNPLANFISHTNIIYIILVHIMRQKTTIAYQLPKSYEAPYRREKAYM